MFAQCGRAGLGRHPAPTCARKPRRRHGLATQPGMRLRGAPPATTREVCIHVTKEESAAAPPGSSDSIARVSAVFFSPPQMRGTIQDSFFFKVHLVGTAFTGGLDS